MYRKILVAYNGAPESRLALDEAVRIAPDASVEVHLAAVVHYPSAYLLAGEYVPIGVASRVDVGSWRRA